MKKEKETEKKLLIFDFDGTIADTKELYYKIIYNELKVFGYSYRKVDKVIDFGLSLKRTLKKFGFSFLTTWSLHRKIMRNVEKDLNKIKKCKDVDSIKEIKEKKILVSNSLKEFIIPIIKHFKLKKYFKEIYGAEDFPDKEEFLKKYMKDRQLKKSNCYYIGDRVADVKTAKKVGCKGVSILGKCAWDSQKELIEESPDFLVSSLKDIKKII